MTEYGFEENSDFEVTNIFVNNSNGGKQTMQRIERMEQKNATSEINSLKLNEKQIRMWEQVAAEEGCIYCQKKNTWCAYVNQRTGSCTRKSGSCSTKRTPDVYNPNPYTNPPLNHINY